MAAGYPVSVRRVVSRNPAALAFADALDASGPLPEIPEDLCLVLGGDGTMLQAIHDHGAAHQWLGLNFGHVGFLMNDLPVAHAVDFLRGRLQSGAWKAHGFQRLTMRAESSHGPLSGLATNDVYIARKSGKTCHLRIWLDGHLAADRLACDGIIAATPLGSTAYSFSAGGAASHPLVRSVHLTSICPHAPKLAPVVLPEGAHIRVEVLDPDRRPARVVVDGIAHDDVASVEISGTRKDDVHLAFFDDHDFLHTLLRKVLRR